MCARCARCSAPVEPQARRIKKERCPPLERLRRDALPRRHGIASAPDGDSLLTRLWSDRLTQSINPVLTTYRAHEHPYGQSGQMRKDHVVRTRKTSWQTGKPAQCGSTCRPGSLCGPAGRVTAGRTGAGRNHPGESRPVEGFSAAGPADFSATRQCADPDP